MGREVKRVPLGFEWPMHETWFGYTLDPVECELCDGRGKPADHETVVTILPYSGKQWESEYCPVCEGEGQTWPRIEVPKGPGWQMWENVSEGSPISPVFETPEELARWLADTGASAFGSTTASYDEWLSTIKRGWAPSAIMSTPNGMESGVSGTHRMDESK